MRLIDMDARGWFIAYTTLVRKEADKIFRVPIQMLVAPVVTALLIFFVIGGILGQRLGEVHGISFVEFAVPGVILLSVMTHSYLHAARNLFNARKVHGNIEELVVSPAPSWIIVLGYATVGALRGIIVGCVVFFVTLFFAVPSGENVMFALFCVLLSALSLSLLGVAAGLLSRNLEDISTANTFVITPAIYIGGVFHSVTYLSEGAARATEWNPLFYLVNGFRYGFSGAADVAPAVSASVLVLVFVCCAGLALSLAYRRVGLRQ